MQGKCVILGDFNGHVGKDSDGYEDVHGGFGFGRRNEEGERVLDFADSFNLKIGNTWFKKDEEKLVTFESGDHRTTIDYVLIRKEERVKNVTAIPGEEVMTQHRVLVMDLLFRKKSWKKAPAVRRIKVWRLKEAKVQSIIKEKVRNAINERDDWEEKMRHIAKIMKEVCGTSKRGGCRRDTWWWNNEEVKKAIKEKKEKYKIWRRVRSDEARAVYIEFRSRARRAVAMAMKEAAPKEASEIENMRLEERLRHVYRMAKAKANSKKDVVGNPCMRGHDGRLRLLLDDRLKMWKEYCEELLNKEYTWENTLERRQVEGPVWEVTVEEVRKAMAKMKMNKAAGPSGVPIEAIRLCELEISLAKIGNDMMSGKRMPASWKRSVLIPLYKGKGDVKECNKLQEPQID